MEGKTGHIKAFTIVEAVVSMAVTAIVLAIIFVIFSVTSERLLDFKKQNGAVTDMNRMCYSINKAIFECETMELRNENELCFKGSYGGETKYHISKELFILDRGDFTDTFRLETKKITTDLLQGKNGQYFLRLQWVIVHEKKEIPLGFYKRIYPDELLKQEADEF